LAVKTLDQVLSELQGTYQPQIDTLRQRQSAIPDQINQNEQQLQAKQTQAFGDITDAARRRGLGFSGIPLSEQAKYTSTEFLPALAKLRQSGQDQAMSLEDAINGVLERRNTLAQQLVSQSQQQDLQERQFQEQIRQFNEQQKAAAAANSFSPSYGGDGGSSFGGGSATATQRGDRGFNFTDAYGRPISAAAYAKAKGLNFRDVLTMMASAGDQGAKSALGFVGNDFGYDPNKITSQNLANLYNSLAYGVGRQATYNPVRVVSGGDNRSVVVR
jgi:hypothetical protein